MKVGIIGGGASGVLAAIYAKKRNDEVVIFERNKECCKKILVTGNGRCNYWNEDQDLSHYQSTTPELLSEFFNIDYEVLNFFKHLGIVPKIKNGYYYPFSNQASTIKNALLNELKDIEVKNNYLVTRIEKLAKGFNVISDNETIYVDKLVLATGSYAAPKTGSDGMGYKFLEKLGHTIIKPLPSLVQLKGYEKYFRIWTGVRTDAKVSLFINQQLVREEIGELQLTNYGLSGICIFNLSNAAARALDNKLEVEVNINFMPFIDIDYKKWFIKQTTITNKKIKELLLSILNEKIVEVIFQVPNKLFTNLTEAEQNKIINLCTNFKIKITGTNTFNEAQVCSGGISIKEIDLQTMKSKLVKDLYVTGELLDITGDCGGYNLSIAWISGIKAGLGVAND